MRKPSVQTLYHIQRGSNIDEPGIEDNPICQRQTFNLLIEPFVLSYLGIEMDGIYQPGSNDFFSASRDQEEEKEELPHISPCRIDIDGIHQPGSRGFFSAARDEEDEKKEELPEIHSCRR